MKRLLLGFAAFLLASPSLAQGPNFPTQMGGTRAPGVLAMCLDSLGNAVPCPLADTTPSIAKAFQPAKAEDRGQVVSISPNSGAFNPFPANATPATAVGTGTTGAVTATMAATAGKTNWVCQVQISAIGGTATIGPVTITGLKGGNTLTYQLASTAAGNYLPISFTPCFPASAVNTAIAAATTADGTASAVDVNILGYLQ